MQLSGSYQTYQTHDQAYVAFVNKVEQLIKGKEAAFVEIAQDKDTNPTPNNTSTPNGKEAKVTPSSVAEVPVAEVVS